MILARSCCHGLTAFGLIDAVCSVRLWSARSWCSWFEWFGAVGWNGSVQLVRMVRCSAWWWSQRHFCGGIAGQKLAMDASLVALPQTLNPIPLKISGAYLVIIMQMT